MGQISKESINKILEIFDYKEKNEKLLLKIKNIIKNKEAEAGISELEELFLFLENFNEPPKGYPDDLLWNQPKCKNKTTIEKSGRSNILWKFFRKNSFLNDFEKSFNEIFLYLFK